MSTPVFPNSARAIPKTQTEREADQARADAAMPDPPDEPGDEMTYGARVWKTYVRETDQADKELVEGRNNSLDVLLIFAALFSAISSAFVIESLGDLKPDPAESSAQTLLAISRTLAAISNGQPVDPSSLGSVDTPTFSPSRTAVAVNALWFLSLGLSVAVSLIAMLAKEWCYLFLSRRSGPMYEQARRRQERWNGIKRWKMKEVLTYLPGLMHLALLLFAAGLCIYLWDTNVAVAIPFVVVTISASVIYLGTTVVSVFDKFCPYATPATPLSRIALHGFFSGVASLLVKKLSPKCLAAVIKETSGDVETRNSKSGSHHVADSKVPMDGVTGQMLEWIVTKCEDPRSVDIAVEALAGASTEFLYGPLGESELMSSLPKRVSQFLDKCHIGTDDAYVLGDQRRLALVMLYSRINNLLLYEGTYGCITHVIGRWLTLGNDVFLYHIEISGIINEMLFTDTESIKNPNALALVVATAMPSCAQIIPETIPDYERYAPPQRETINMITYALGDRRSALWATRMASLLEKHLSSEGPRLSSNALHALVESSIHYLVGLYPRQRAEERHILVLRLLAQLYFALPASSADLQTIAVILAATEFATHSYPGGEEPANDIKSWGRRALKVIKHYQENPPDYKSTADLFYFGFVGLLSELTSDGWTKHGNTMGHLLKSLDERYRMRSFDTFEFSIYTLQTSLDRESRRALAACRCLSSLSRSTFTQDAEKAMHISCLHLTGRSPPSSKLYFAALVALRYAQSTVLQSFCLEIVNSQHAPPPSDVLVHEVSENSVLRHLRYIPTLGMPHFTIIHMAYLVAAILLSTDVPSSGRLVALEPAIKRGPPLDMEPSDGADYSSSLAGAMDQTSGPEALRHIMGCAASFYHATETQKAELDEQIVAHGDHSHWEAKLRRFRSNCELKSLGLKSLGNGSRNEPEPDAQYPAGVTEIDLAQNVEQETPD